MSMSGLQHAFVHAFAGKEGHERPAAQKAWCRLKSLNG